MQVVGNNPQTRAQSLRLFEFIVNWRCFVICTNSVNILKKTRRRTCFILGFHHRFYCVVLNILLNYFEETGLNYTVGLGPAYLYDKRLNRARYSKGFVFLIGSLQSQNNMLRHFNMKFVELGRCKNLLFTKQAIVYSRLLLAYPS